MRAPLAAGVAVDPGLVREFLSGTLPPVLVAAALVGWAWKPWRRRAAQGSDKTLGAEPGLTRPERVSLPAALGLGYLAGHLALRGWPSLALDVRVDESLFYVVAGALGLGLLEAYCGRSFLLGRAALALALPLFLLDFMREHHWSRQASVFWNAGIALAVFTLWQAFDALARRSRGASLPFVGLGVGTLLAATLALSGSVLLAQLCGAFVAPLGVCFLLGLRCPATSLAGGTSGLFVLPFGTLVLAGHFASELGGPGALLLCLAPLAPWAFAGGRGAGWRGARWAGIALALALAGTALGLEQAAVPADPYGQPWTPPVPR